jgi:hypothetical protein
MIFIIKNRWQRNQKKKALLQQGHFLNNQKESALVLFRRKSRAKINNQSTIRKDIKVKEDEKYIVREFNQRMS